MNAVELDVSVSRDNVVFLWSDPMPADPIAQARTLVSIKVFVITTFTCVIFMYHLFQPRTVRQWPVSARVQHPVRLPGHGLLSHQTELHLRQRDRRQAGRDHPHPLGVDGRLRC